MVSSFTKDELKKHLKNNRISTEWLFQSHVIQRRSHLFSLENEGHEKEMEFRSSIAQACGIHLNEVHIVGSAQIGFSIKPNVKLLDMDGKYEITKNHRDKSDIDVAIVSEKYFHQLEESMGNFTSNYKTPWEFNKYYANKSKLSHYAVPRVDYQFYTHVLRGWFRPDFCPDAFILDHEKAISPWKTALNRKIAVGIYKNWKNLKDYQENAFISLRNLAIKDEL